LAEHATGGEPVVSRNLSVSEIDEDLNIHAGSIAEESVYPAQIAAESTPRRLDLSTSIAIVIVLAIFGLCCYFAVKYLL